MKDLGSRCSYFIPPGIIQVTFGFLIFSGSIKGEHWEETSQAFLLISAQCSSFLHPCERQKTLDLLLIPGGIESEH